jgi:hypothetical protein
MEDVQLDGRRCSRIAVTTQLVDTLPILLGQIESIAKRFWNDLVHTNDYFGPRAEWNTTARTPVPAAEFVVSLNPELQLAGDYISRCLVRRVEVVQGILDEVYRLLSRAYAKRANPRARREAAAVQRNWHAVTGLTARLRHMCLADSGQSLRDACVLLTQIYAGFAPEPALHWLGVSESVMQTGRATIRHRVMSQHDVAFTDRVAAGITQVAALYVDSGPEQSAFEEAVSSGALVLRANPQGLFWEGKEQHIEWSANRAAWEFLCMLARKASRGAAVGEGELYGDAVVSPSTMANRCNRLKQVIPASLRKHIRPGGSPRTYRLYLEPRQVFLFGEVVG